MAASPEITSKLCEQLEPLRRTDNWTNWIYILRAYAVIVAAVILAISFCRWSEVHELSRWWNLPVFTFAIVAIGASQHQLAGATHEATHRMLFRNRWLNELVSDWLCMFPLFSSTHLFRHHHLAHHQFINDPRRDPDFAQLRESGHDLDFPLSAADFLRTVVHQLTLVPLVRYILVRSRFNAIAGPPPRSSSKVQNSGSGWWLRFPVGYLIVLFTAMVTATRLASSVWLAIIPALGLSAAAVFVIIAPPRAYPESPYRSVVSQPATLFSRFLFVTLLAAALAWTDRLTGYRAWFYFFILWVVPIFTTFAFFMILRQVVQHGNGDRGRYTNTRVFHVNALLRYAVFPFGMDYHLPHHLHANVPHFRLRELHELLMTGSAYRELGTVVEGYFIPNKSPHNRPTVLEVLSSRHPKRSSEIFIDDTVLEDSRAVDADPNETRSAVSNG